MATPLQPSPFLLRRRRSKFGQHVYVLIGIGAAVFLLAIVGIIAISRSKPSDAAKGQEVAEAKQQPRVSVVMRKARPVLKVHFPWKEHVEPEVHLVLSWGNCENLAKTGPIEFHFGPDEPMVGINSLRNSEGPDQEIVRTIGLFKDVHKCSDVDGDLYLIPPQETSYPSHRPYFSPKGRMRVLFSSGPEDKRNTVWEEELDWPGIP
jgi:hypothetical protein